MYNLAPGLRRHREGVRRSRVPACLPIGGHWDTLSSLSATRGVRGVPTAGALTARKAKAVR